MDAVDLYSFVNVFQIDFYNSFVLSLPFFTFAKFVCFDLNVKWREDELNIYFFCHTNYFEVDD